MNSPSSRVARGEEEARARGAKAPFALEAPPPFSGPKEISMRWLLLLLLLLAAPAAAAPSDLDLPVKRFVLENGLTVLLLERHDAPVFSGYLFVRVGSANERPGITGGSHLLEHMMFKGTKLF